MSLYRHRTDQHSIPAPKTGRRFALLPNGKAAALGRFLKRAAGLRVGLSSDFTQGAFAIGLRRGEALVYENLGIALVDADADEMRALAGHPDAQGLRWEPERGVRGNAWSTGEVAMHALAADTAFATWGVQAIGALASRHSGRGVRIAVLDTGLDITHPDFAGRHIACTSFIADRTLSDTSGHGTCCAGIAAGPEQPSDAPRYGVAYGADLFIAKVLESDAEGTDGNVLAGIDWAVRNQCAVVSLSVGTPVHVGDPYPQVYEQAAAGALAAGTLLIAPAGNTSERPDDIAPVDYPANCPSVISVGAVDSHLAVAPFSNGGLNAHGGEINLAAPGIAIVSAAPGPSLYQVASGTSMAAAFVAGIAALVAEAHPEARGAALREHVLRAVRPLSAAPRDVGAGLVQAPE